MSTNAAERLARAVKQRRCAELDLTQLDVRAAGGPSNSTLTAIEAGTLERAPSRTTFRKLDVGLQWEPGSAKRVWAGEGEPTPLLPARAQLAPRDREGVRQLREVIAEADLDQHTKNQLLGVLSEDAPTASAATDRRGVKGA